MAWDGPTGRWMLIGGYNLLGTGEQIKEWEQSQLDPTIEETTAVNDTRTQRKPSGHIGDAAMRFLGWLTDATQAMWEALQLTAQASGSYWPAIWGETLADEGSVCWAGKALRATVKRLVPGKELTKCEVGLAFDGGVLFSRVLYPLTTNANASWDTQAASVDNGTKGAAIVVDTSSVANPSVITTTTAHGFLTGDTVLIASHVGSTPDINGSHTVTVTGTTTFTIAVNVTVGGTGGTATRTSTRNGGYVWQQVTALTLGGYTNFAGIAQHSVDDVVFTTLASFTVVTVAPASECKAVTGAINRYTAYSAGYTGAGAAQSVTVAAAVSRKEL